MNAQSVVREHRSQLLQLRGLADADLAGLVAALEGLSVADVRNALIEVMPDLLAPYELAAGELAAVAYEDLRAASAARGTFYAETAPAVFTPGKAEGTARWAVGTLVDESLEATLYTRLAGSAARAIFDMSRETMELNGSREQTVRFQRMARPGTCAFCGMLASRPAWQAYKSEGAAQAGSHDNCQCLVMPIYPGTEMAQLADVERQKFERMYQQARADESGRSLSDPKDILAEWRRYHGTH